MPFPPPALRRVAVWGACVALVLLAAVRPTSAQEVVEATIQEVHEAMRAGTLTCRGLVEAYLTRIEAYDQQGPRLNTVQTVNPRARELADSLDGVWASGAGIGPLHCVPVLLKDQVETADMPTTYGSVLFQDFTSHRDATLVRRLRDAGALILAKTNMGEFASRYVGSAYGIIRNPYAPDRNPSGSSGGTSAGVAASFGLVGIGEDTSGSIRGPAAVANLVGLRPTLGLVSVHGMMPSHPSQDTMGPITRTVADAARLLDGIAGYDPADPVTAWSVDQVPETYTAALDPGALQGTRVGVVRTPQDAGTDPESEDYRKVRAVLDRALEDLRAAGAVVVDSVEVPHLLRIRDVWGNPYETEEAIDAYLAELRDPPHTSLADILLTGEVNPWRAQGLVGLLGRSTDEAGYAQLLTTREEIRRGVLQAMAEHDLDVLVHATFDHQPTLIAPDVETNPDPDDGYGWGDNRGLSPVTGFPALTVPAGFTTDQLPVGLELLGRPFDEPLLLGLGYAYEQATGHRRTPSTTPPLVR